MWNFTLGSLLVRAGASSEGQSQQRALRGAPDPERYPMLAAAAATWTAAHDRDTYREDLGTLIDALLEGLKREVQRAPGPARSGSLPSQPTAEDRISSTGRTPRSGRSEPGFR
jgi:hypothetical protein